MLFVCFNLKRKMARHAIISVHELSLNVWLDVQELGKKMIEKLVTRKFEEEASRQTSLKVQNTRRYLYPM